MKGSYCLLLLLLTSCSSFMERSPSSEDGSTVKNCFIDGYVQSPPHVWTDSRFTGHKFEVRSESWEECYLKAIEIAKETQAYSISYPVYFKWNFNDGYLYDTKGKVSHYTDQFVKAPQKGDQRYFANGSRF
jgi:hypothetical protein